MNLVDWFLGERRAFQVVAAPDVGGPLMLVSERLAEALSTTPRGLAEELRGWVARSAEQLEADGQTGKWRGFRIVGNPHVDVAFSTALLNMDGGKPQGVFLGVLLGEEMAAARAVSKLGKELRSAASMGALSPQ